MCVSVNTFVFVYVCVFVYNVFGLQRYADLARLGSTFLINEISAHLVPISDGLQVIGLVFTNILPAPL